MKSKDITEVRIRDVSHILRRLATKWARSDRTGISPSVSSIKSFREDAENLIARIRGI